MRPGFRQRLKENYQRLKGYVWNGFLAPELTPDIQSSQVLALAEIVEELEDRVRVIENLYKISKGYVP